MGFIAVTGGLALRKLLHPRAYTEIPIAKFLRLIGGISRCVHLTGVKDVLDLAPPIEATYGGIFDDEAMTSIERQSLQKEVQR